MNVSDGPASESVRTGPIRVFLLDDHEIVRQGIATVLEAEPDSFPTWPSSTYASVTATEWRSVARSDPTIPKLPV